ncbi:MAG TPA: resistance to Congo red protein [Streptosporangiaceae bacterium]|nr:resistance to Congo red protein [Streptosporangiaceae bacterium]
MTNGLILLVFMALLVAFFWARARRRLGLTTMNGRSWLVLMAVFVLAVLALWAYSTH